MPLIIKLQTRLPVNGESDFLINDWFKGLEIFPGFIFFVMPAAGIT